MWKDIKLTKTQIPKVIQSGGSAGKMFDNMIGKLGTKALLDLAVPLAKDFCA